MTSDHSGMEKFSSLWKELHVKLQKADELTLPGALRSVMALTDSAQGLDILDSESTGLILSEYLECYHKAYDAVSSQNDLGVLPSSTGSCMLSMERARGLQCVRSLLNASQRAQAPEKNPSLISLRSLKHSPGTSGQTSSDIPFNGKQHVYRSETSVRTQPSNSPDFDVQGTHSASSKQSDSNKMPCHNNQAFWNLYSDQRPPQQKQTAASNEQPVPKWKDRSIASELKNPPTQNYKSNEQLKRPRDSDAEETNDSPLTNTSCFKTARQQLVIDNQKKFGRDRGGSTQPAAQGPPGYGSSKRSLGTRRGPASKFVPPVLNKEEQDDGGTLVRKAGAKKAADEDEQTDERLKNIEPKMVELIMSEIMDSGPSITWDDIAGLEFAKKTIKEIVIWPMLRPDIFTGLRGPPKGLMLFGPPGTGKTLIGKCIASQSKSTFFSISASSLTSKWVGEGEKMVRALFAVARVHQPAVVFIDEIDSLLGQRSDTEHESSRRIKTEFLVQLDGATTGDEDRILVVGATNRPQEIDEAARRRFVKRLYIPLPEAEARIQIVQHLMSKQKHVLSDAELQAILLKSDGYSGADMTNLCREAALGPIRSLAFCDIENITPEEVRPIKFCDFESAFHQVRASVSERDLDAYLEWNRQYGSWGM